MAKKKLLTCEDCGKKDETVERGPCPYESDVNEDNTPVNLCPECSAKRAEEI
jgi:DNA-directed RNA polymerase subunit RPC12/RpoP